jgi:hypothetical protein
VAGVAPPTSSLFLRGAFAFAPNYYTPTRGTSGPQKQVETTSATMLYLIGLGLADETDVTVKGLDIIKKASRVYLEAYTAVLLVDKEKLVNANGPQTACS